MRLDLEDVYFQMENVETILGLIKLYRSTKISLFKNQNSYFCMNETIGVRMSL